MIYHFRFIIRNFPYFHISIFPYLLLTSYLLLLTSCLCLHADLPKDILRMLEAGEFSKYEDAVAKLDEKGADRHFAIGKLYEGNYLEGFSLIKNGGREDFWFQYLRFMAAMEREFLSKESEHFKIRYTNPNDVMVDFALENLETIYRKNGEILGHFPEDKILVEIYPDKETFAAASTLGMEILEKSGTVGICKFNRIMLISPRTLPLGYRWLDTLSHEYAHFLINRITRYNCPLWLHEGIARYTDTQWRKYPPSDESGHPNFISDYSMQKLTDAVAENRLIPFEKMSPSLVYLPTRDDISLAFAEVSSFVDFFARNYGKDALGRLLTEMQSMTEKNAFRKITRQSFGALNRRWIDNLKKLKLETATAGIPDTPDYVARTEDDFLSLDARQNVRLGDAFRQKGNFVAALSQYEKSFEKEKSPVVAVKIARTQVSMGKLTEAKENLLKVVKGNENYLTPYLVLAEISAMEGNEGEAKHFLKEAFSINPFYPGLYQKLSEL